MYTHRRPLPLAPSACPFGSVSEHGLYDPDDDGEFEFYEAIASPLGATPARRTTATARS